MAYDETSFLSGVAAGLTATGGRQLTDIRKTLLTGSSRMDLTPVLNSLQDTFISKVLIETSYPVTILYEYGPYGTENLTRESRRVRAAPGETQTFYHACQIAEPIPLRDFNYSVYLLERRGMGIRFDAKFMSYPFQGSGLSLTYPGTPEAVDIWWVRTIRQ